MKPATPTLIASLTHPTTERLRTVGIKECRPPARGLTQLEAGPGGAFVMTSRPRPRGVRPDPAPMCAAYQAARDECYRVYGRTRGVHTRLRLLSNVDELVLLADRAIDRATEIKDAGSEDDRATRGEGQGRTRCLPHEGGRSNPLMMPVGARRALIGIPSTFAGSTYR
jgi:hypothetical protein